MEIEKAKKEEKKQEAKPELRKITLLNDQEERWVLTLSSDFYLLNGVEVSALTIDNQPPTPPPRARLAIRA